MTIFLKTDANPTSPDSTMPYLEKDSAIIRGVTRAMFDFSNPDCYSGTGNIVGGSTSFNDLSVNTLTASAQTNFTHVFAPVETGMIKIQSGSGENRYISLPPSAFKFPVTVKRALIILYAKIPSSGYTANMLGGLIGSGTDQIQYTSWLASDASGNLSYLRFRLKGSSGNIDVDVNSSLLVGSAKQIGFAIDVRNTGITEVSIFIDGVLKASATGAMTQFYQYVNSGVSDNALFYSPLVSFLSDQTNDVRLGRVSSHDLTSRSDLSFADILAKDLSAASGYVY